MSRDRSVDRHEQFEELISASLSGDLTSDERRRLDAHLDTCETCRATLAAFADQRRMVAGLRHVPVPHDLDARVRAGVERAAVPWWRRPRTILLGATGGLAVVAGALLALVLLDTPADEPQVGEATPTLTPSFVTVPSATPILTLPPSSPGSSSAATPTPQPSEPASPAATPAPTPIPVSPEPAVFVAVTGDFDNQAMTVRDGTTGATVGELEAPSGEPIAAELSPDGQWLAYITTVGLSGMNEVRATRIADESESAAQETIVLGRSVAGSPFLERLFWSPDSRYLAFSLADTSGGGVDAWLLDTSQDLPGRKLTNTGTTYAGSFTRDGHLWVSSAGETPTGYLLPASVVETGEEIDADALADVADDAADVFQPLISPNGAFLIYWTGRMQRVGDEWLFSEGGAPWLAENRDDGQGGYEFASARYLFGDLTIDQDAFASAAITWGGDSDAYAVWDAAWTGVPQSPSGDYPNPARVYFGHATDPRGLTLGHAIDAGDIPPDGFVVDVKVAPTGRHLVVTAGQPRPGDLAPPSADLLLIERNTGTVPDGVTVIGNAAEGWFGPAAFPAPDEGAAP